MSQIKKPQTKKPQKKKQKNYFTIIAAITIPVILAIISIAVLNNKPFDTTEDNTAKFQTVKDHDLVIQTSDISEKANYYPVEIAGTKLEVIAVKAPDGTIRTAFNTCQVCYDSGRGYYVQQGNVLVCQNCGNRFGMSDVEVTRGGCNPVPISSEDKTVNDTSITISKEFLSKSKTIFANWKS